MSLTVGSNSWVTVAEATDFLNDRYGASGWASLSNEDQEQLLVTAFWKIYGNKDYTISKDNTDEKVKTAQIVTAWYIYENYDEIKKRMTLQGQGVQSFTISKFSETFKKDGGSWLPEEAEDLLNEAFSLNIFATFERELD